MTGRYHRNRIFLLLGTLFFLFTSTYAFACSFDGGELTAGSSQPTCHHVAATPGAVSSAHISQLRHTPDPLEDHCCQLNPVILRSQNSDVADSYAALTHHFVGVIRTAAPQFSPEQRELHFRFRQTASFYRSINYFDGAGRAPPSPSFLSFRG